jgi:hypothetical protein
MVLQILANPGQVPDDVDSKTAQCLRFPHAREHQDLRAADGAGGKDHFLVGPDVLDRAIRGDLDAHTTSPLEVQFHDVRIEQQSQVRPRQRRAQEGASRTHPSPIRGDVHVDVAGTGVHGSVHVIQNRHAHLASSVEEGGRCGMGIPRAADMYRASDSAPGIGPTLPILLSLEDWEHLGEGPACGSIPRPPVVVSLHAARPHHGIDAAAAPQHVTEGHVELSIVQSRRRADGQVVVERPADVVEPDARVRDRRCVVESSRLDDEYLRAGRGQFSRQDRTGRACSHHDEVIVSLERRLPFFLVRPGGQSLVERRTKCADRRRRPDHGEELAALETACRQLVEHHLPFF